MPFKIVRNDITKMQVDAIVNPSNSGPVVGAGSETAIYEAAGREALMEERKSFGSVSEGEVFLTGGYGLPAAHVIHAVSPRFQGGNQGEEERLRSCYRKSLELAAKQGFQSIAFPLIATGSYGYPREEAMGIAAEEIRAFLDGHEMMIYLTVFDEASSALGGRLYPDLEAYIDRHYVEEKLRSEYAGAFMAGAAARGNDASFQTAILQSAQAQGNAATLGVAKNDSPVTTVTESGDAVAPMSLAEEYKDATVPKLQAAECKDATAPMMSAETLKDTAPPKLMASLEASKQCDQFGTSEKKEPGLFRRLLSRENKASESAPRAANAKMGEAPKYREAPMVGAARLPKETQSEDAEFCLDDLEEESYEKAPKLLRSEEEGARDGSPRLLRREEAPVESPQLLRKEEASVESPQLISKVEACDEVSADWDFEKHESALNERMTHLSDTYQQYLFYLIENKGMTNAEVYKRAIVDKKVFAKIKANPEYHPKKMTALCLCVGAKLNLDETRDLLARAGYALSPCDKTDVIFSYFIEHGIYDMIEIDIQLEEHGLPCIIA